METPTFCTNHQVVSSDRVFFKALSPRQHLSSICDDPQAGHQISLACLLSSGKVTGSLPQQGYKRTQEVNTDTFSIPNITMVTAATVLSSVPGGRGLWAKWLLELDADAPGPQEIYLAADRALQIPGCLGACWEGGGCCLPAGSWRKLRAMGASPLKMRFSQWGPSQASWHSHR